MTNAITVRALCKICMQEQFHEQKYDGRKVPMWTAAIERAISNRLRRELSAGEVVYKVKSAIVEKDQPMPKHTFEQDEVMTTWSSDSLTCYCWVFLPTRSSPPKDAKAEKMSPPKISPPIAVVAPPPVKSQQEESIPEEEVTEDEPSTQESEPEPVNEEGSSFWFNPLSVVPTVSIPTIDPNPLSWFSRGEETTDTESSSSSPPLFRSNSIITMITTALELDHEPTKNRETEHEVTAETNQPESTSKLDETTKENHVQATVPIIDSNPLSWFSGIGGTTGAEPSAHSSSSSQPNSIITMITTALELDHEPSKNRETEQEVTAETNQPESTSKLDETTKENRPKEKGKPVWDIRTSETIAAAVSVKRGQFVLASDSADDNDDGPSPLVAGGTVTQMLEKKTVKKWPTVQTGASSRAVPSKPLSTSSPRQNKAIDSSQTKPVTDTAATAALPTSITADKEVKQSVVAVAANVTKKLAKATGTTVPPSPSLSTMSEQESSDSVTESDWLKPTPSSASVTAVARKQPSPSSSGRTLSTPLDSNGTTVITSPPGHLLGSTLPTRESPNNSSSIGGAVKNFAATISPAAKGEQWPPRPITELYPAPTLSHPYDLYEHSLLNPSDTTSANASARNSARASPTYLSQSYQLQNTVLPPSVVPAVYANPTYEDMQTKYQSTHTSYGSRPVSTSGSSLDMSPLPPVPLKTTRLTLPASVGDGRIHVLSQSGVEVGMKVIIGEGPFLEAKLVQGFGSVVLDSPLAKSHAAGSAVNFYDPEPPTPLYHPAPSWDRHGLSSPPSPPLLMPPSPPSSTSYFSKPRSKASAGVSSHGSTPIPTPTNNSSNAAGAVAYGQGLGPGQGQGLGHHGADMTANVDSIPKAIPFDSTVPDPMRTAMMFRRAPPSLLSPVPPPPPHQQPSSSSSLRLQHPSSSSLSSSLSLQHPSSTSSSSVVLAWVPEAVPVDPSPIERPVSSYGSGIPMPPPPPALPDGVDEVVAAVTLPIPRAQNRAPVFATASYITSNPSLLAFAQPLPPKPASPVTRTGHKAIPVDSLFRTAERK